MERKEQIKSIILVFSTIMKRMVNPSFKIVNPQGGIAMRTINTCLDSLEKIFGDEISRERIVDFCVCQAYRVNCCDTKHTEKWGVQQYFGNKAIESFISTNKNRKYYEDKWLGEKVPRHKLLSLIANRREHPQYKFIFPQYEEGTKKRMLNTDVGYYICGQSTLLWTPFSPTCQMCTKSETCKQRTQQAYPELYRIRTEEFNQK